VDSTSSGSILWAVREGSDTIGEDIKEGGNRKGSV